MNVFNFLITLFARSRGGAPAPSSVRRSSPHPSNLFATLDGGHHLYDRATDTFVRIPRWVRPETQALLVSA